MPDSILPPSFLCLLAAFSGCFHAPSYANFRLIVASWVHCLGRRTVTGVVLAAGGVGGKHISVFHRFFGRAAWALDGVGELLLVLPYGIDARPLLDQARESGVRRVVFLSSGAVVESGTA